MFMPCFGNERCHCHLCLTIVVLLLIFEHECGGLWHRSWQPLWKTFLYTLKEDIRLGFQQYLLVVLHRVPGQWYFSSWGQLKEGKQKSCLADLPKTVGLALKSTIPPWFMLHWKWHGPVGLEDKTGRPWTLVWCKFIDDFSADGDWSLHWNWSFSLPRKVHIQDYRMLTGLSFMIAHGTEAEESHCRHHFDIETSS